MANVIRLAHVGGPDVLCLETVTLPVLGQGEVLLRQTHIGVNFIDVYHRSGIYPLPLPSGLGVEAVGTVESIGPGVTSFQRGDRVGYVMGPPGAYSDTRILPASALIAIPPGIDSAIGASVLLKGLTAHYLLRQIQPVHPGQTILFHAAAGGTGLLACQWAKALGARVLGTVGSQAKVGIAKAHGCDEVIVLTEGNLVNRVRELTEGKGVPVVFDGIGKDTFEASLDCLSPRGLLVSFGQSSGKVPPFDITLLSAKGSLMLTRPTLATFIANPVHRQAMATEVFNAILTKVLTPKTPHAFPLADAAAAHLALENRQTTGSLILLPET